MFVSLLFYFFATVTLGGALMVVTSRHPVRAVLSLVLSFVGGAGTWMLLEAEFLALTLIVVYVGAVMVLFLFVVMMLDVDEVASRGRFVRFWPAPVVFSIILFGMLYLIVGPDQFGLDKFPKPPSYGPDFSHIEAIGMNLYRYHLWPFELSAALLLTGMVAAIVLTFRGKRPNAKGVDPSIQLNVRPEDRLRMVKMPSGQAEKGDEL